jgi:DNA segregation ATPase FtsK/SpoIIIE, S-DNA-T family
MATTVFRREPRQDPPEAPDEELELQEPPGLPDDSTSLASGGMSNLPMALGAVGGAGMMMMFILPSITSMSGTTKYLLLGGMGALMLTMLGSQLLRGIGERKKQTNSERREYLRYLGQMREKVSEGALAHRRALQWRHPAPAGLVGLVTTRRMWERRAEDEDFLEARIGVGTQLPGIRLTTPRTKPVEDLEPLSALALRRFVEAWGTADELPVAVQLRSYSRLLLHGDDAAARTLVRALLAQLAVFHSPAELRIAVCTAPRHLAHWEWAKWLPHCQHPSDTDAGGPARMVVEDLNALDDLLGKDEMEERPGFEAGSVPAADESAWLVVVDGPTIPDTSRLAGKGYRNLTVLGLGEALAWVHNPLSLRLEVEPSEVTLVEADSAGKDRRSPVGEPDSLSRVRARSLARRLAGYRVGGQGETDLGPMLGEVQLTSLLNIPDATDFEPSDYQRGPVSNNRLRVPIGVDESGNIIELDIKESAQGGMGPHGMLVGATGSGKSELLRTLVLSMAASHSSESLNMVLVDFKGGATFLGLEDLPHVCAVITNLADDLSLVDRMQDSLHGELVRRQELLREKGHPSLLEYERARADGAPLDPLPALFLIVDEFSELLSAKQDFINLFVMVCRLGRSLGVHLLLATQRLEEGRIHSLEGHLSYRIGLRMFSSSESRGVLGVTDAYELPLPPGHGFLRTDTSTMVRFKGAYVSGKVRLSSGQVRVASGRVLREIVPFTHSYLPVPEQTLEQEREQAEADELAAQEQIGAQTLLEVMAGQLAGSGPPAHQVWLPPLHDPPTLDGLLDGLRVTPERGLTAGEGGTLRVPLGIVDKPFEQRWDLLMADVSGAGGHVGVVGGPQSGKSTMLRSLILGLALTHSPQEVQFYCMDFSGGALGSLADLPHVGSVAGRTDVDRVGRTLAEVLTLMAMRERVFAARGVDTMVAYRRMRSTGEVTDDPFGDLFVVVDGWHTVRSEFEHLEPLFQEITARGLGYGVHLVVGTSRWAELRPWLRDAMGTRFELRLGDPIDSAIGSRIAANVPTIPGRGLTGDGKHFLSVLPRVDGSHRSDDVAEGTAAAVQQVRAAWQGPGSPPVRMLPGVLEVTELPEPQGSDEPASNLRVPLGMAERDLQPIWHDFGQSPHLMIFGDGESGKTNLLRCIARSITQQMSPDGARILLTDYRRELHSSVPEENRLGYAVSGQALEGLLTESAAVLTERTPGSEITPDRLAQRDWWQGPRLFVLVDDYDLVASGSQSPLTELLDLLPMGSEIGLHLILARAASGASRVTMMDPVIRRLWDLGTPAVMYSCPKDEGAFLGTFRPQQLPPGRANYLTRRGPQLMQTSYLRETSTSDVAV